MTTINQKDLDLILSKAIEDRPINEQITIYNENEINDRIARLETLKVERFVHVFSLERFSTRIMPHY